MLIDWYAQKLLSIIACVAGAKVRGEGVRG